MLCCAALSLYTTGMMFWNKFMQSKLERISREWSSKYQDVNTRYTALLSQSADSTSEIDKLKR